MNIFIDELIRKLIEIRNDGYYYCTIDFLPEDEFEGETIPPSIGLEAIDLGGAEGISYSENEETEVYEVTEDELLNYAFQNKPPAPNRKKIKNISIIE